MELTINKEVAFKKFNDKGLLIKKSQGTYKRLNSTALFIIELIEKYQKMSRETLLNELSEYYKIPIRLFKEDVDKFINNIIELDYLRSDEKKPETKEVEMKGGCKDNGLWIKVTNRCNLACKYCYAESGEEEGKDEITLEEIENLLEELKDQNFSKIVITGGEPLLRKDIIEILKKCSEYGHVMVLTNGTLYNEELYKTILDYVMMIQISMDSHEKGIHEFNRGTDTYDKIIKSIDFINSQSKDKLTLSMTPTPEHLGNIVKMIDFCIDNEIYNLHINRFVPYGRAKEQYGETFNLNEFYRYVDAGYSHLKEIYIKNMEQKKVFRFNLDVANDFRKAVHSTSAKTSCGLNESLVSIDSNGDVYLCASLHKEQFKIGNIRENNIVELRTKSTNEHGSFCVDCLTRCQNCDVKYFCGGGCRALALNDSNDIYGTDSNCELYKQRIYNLMLSFDA
ncbi:PqqD family peptide modification chaperone [Alkaliphilus hydrothermalis]|uniref:Radical SAM protein with 4Fe4S-binding SPASM domain n=1 Tax=Alkaliphilus hydrothermalis TaxID=1482730 RepID=A0ABS2NRF6_9FIRM|nr:PqqD family peptide modification chaperone [Alkaliphilus hydrothermalis]MBM7615506.1 radical SAM protein with 4Fe4S-binding SPASM domain [Alkaliphilus hydrothermalis]